MIDKKLEEKILNDIDSSYKNLYVPDFHFIFERENWYSNLLLKIRNIYEHVNDLTDFNYDVSKSIEIIDKQYSENIYLYLSLVGQYSFILRNDIVSNLEGASNDKLIDLMSILENSDITLFSRDELLSVLPIKINFDEDTSVSTVLEILFSPGIVLK